MRPFWNWQSCAVGWPATSTTRAGRSGAGTGRGLFIGDAATSGFPDLVLVRPPDVLFVELKSEKGRMTVNQKKWRRALSQCPGVGYYLWKPGDWGEIRGGAAMREWLANLVSGGGYGRLGALLDKERRMARHWHDAHGQLRERADAIEAGLRRELIVSLDALNELAAERDGLLNQVEELKRTIVDVEAHRDRVIESVTQFCEDINAVGTDRDLVLAPRRPALPHGLRGGRSS